jgi:HK97 family phage major capsid protein
MPPVYNSLVGRDDVAALIPEDASRQIIQDLPKASVALSSFRMARMSRHQQRVPVLNFLPTAYWVGSDTGIKQTTEQQWANLYLDARELAVLVPIPEVVLDDADFDIWGEIRPRLAEAMGAKIDAAALFGTDSPAGWPDSIGEQAIAKGNALTIGDTLVGGRNDFGLDVSATMGLVEDDGFDVTGFWSRRRLRQKLRNLRDDVGQPLFQAVTDAGGSSLYGEPIGWVQNGSWNSAHALIAGDRSAAILAVRQDISYRIFSEGVISDDTGAVILNLMQQDAVVMRATFRVAFQVANPVSREAPDAASRFPFAVLLEEAS